MRGCSLLPGCLSRGEACGARQVRQGIERPGLGAAQGNVHQAAKWRCGRMGILSQALAPLPKRLAQAYGPAIEVAGLPLREQLEGRLLAGDGGGGVKGAKRCLGAHRRAPCKIPTRHRRPTIQETTQTTTISLMGIHQTDGRCELGFAVQRLGMVLLAKVPSRVGHHLIVRRMVHGLDAHHARFDGAVVAAGVPQ